MSRWVVLEAVGSRTIGKRQLLVGTFHSDAERH